MGDYPQPETTEEKIATLRRMSKEEGTFRLSINERAAIAYALRIIARSKSSN
jgi:hypothetical protein